MNSTNELSKEKTQSNKKVTKDIFKKLKNNYFYKNYFIIY